MKWFENVEMLRQTLENNEKKLEEVEYGSEMWNLLTDESNLIKHHLELIKENEMWAKANNFKDLWIKDLLFENQEAIKIATLLKAKRGYIKSKKGNFMELRISNITHDGSRFMVNGYCIYSNNCRIVPLDKVYTNEVLDNEK